MTATAHPVVTLRYAQETDAFSLRRLAELDSAAVPVGEVMLAEVDGVAHAALATSTGTVIADPFEPTERLVELLRATAAEGRTACGMDVRRRIVDPVRARIAAARAPRLADV